MALLPCRSALWIVTGFIMAGLSATSVRAAPPARAVFPGAVPVYPYLSLGLPYGYRGPYPGPFVPYPGPYTPFPSPRVFPGPYFYYYAPPVSSSWAYQSSVLTVPGSSAVYLGSYSTRWESRSEFGPPLLGKLPYASPFFRSVDYGSQATNFTWWMIQPRPLNLLQEDALLLGNSP